MNDEELKARFDHIREFMDRQYMQNHQLWNTFAKHASIIHELLEHNEMETPPELAKRWHQINELLNKLREQENE